MLKTGKWVGYYQFNSEQMSVLRRFERTIFTIEIITINKNEFTGTVQDDLATGGMNGIGTITGKINGNRITFVKQMPKALILHPDGYREERDEPHQPLYYSGVFAADGKTINGEWHFKLPFLLKVYLFIKRLSGVGNGTWSMTMAE